MFIDRNFTGSQNSAEKSCNPHNYRPKCTFEILAKNRKMPLLSLFFDTVLAFLEIFTKPGSKYSETVKYQNLCNIFFSVGYIMLRVGILSGGVPGNGGA
jgi:hypothetical protein